MFSFHMQPPKAATLFYIAKTDQRKLATVFLLRNELGIKEKHRIGNSNERGDLQLNKYQNTPSRSENFSRQRKIAFLKSIFKLFFNILLCSNPYITSTIFGR